MGFGGGAGAAGGAGGLGFGVGGAGAPGGLSGRMGEQGGLRTGWLAAFGTEGYDGEPPLLEELGVNFGHIKVKVSSTILVFLIGSRAVIHCYFPAGFHGNSIIKYTNGYSS